VLTPRMAEPIDFVPAAPQEPEADLEADRDASAALSHEG
jgi:hypothetical protein